MFADICCRAVESVEQLAKQLEPEMTKKAAQSDFLQQKSRNYRSTMKQLTVISGALCHVWWMSDKKARRPIVLWLLCLSLSSLASAAYDVCNSVHCVALYVMSLHRNISQSNYSTRNHKQMWDTVGMFTCDMVMYWSSCWWHALVVSQSHLVLVRWQWWEPECCVATVRVKPSGFTAGWNT